MPIAPGTTELLSRTTLGTKELDGWKASGVSSLGKLAWNSSLQQWKYMEVHFLGVFPLKVVSPKPIIFGAEMIQI